MSVRALIALLTLAASLTVAAAVLAGPGTVLSEQPVRTGPKDELVPSAEFTARGVDILVWTERPHVQPGRGAYHAYFRKGTNSKVRLDAAGTQGYTGGIDPPWIVYQQYSGARSDVKLYRIDTRRRSNPPKGLNTTDWEYSPSISGKWILVGRDDNDSNLKRLILFNRTNRQSRVLATLNGENKVLLPGQVNGNWVVWTTCSRANGCDAFRYNSSSRTKTKLEEPPGTSTLSTYGASVLGNGVVYATRSGRDCGETVRIVRFFRGGDPSTGTEIATPAAGFDIGSGWARKRPNGTVDYLYERVTCSNRRWNLFRVNDPPAP